MLELLQNAVSAPNFFLTLLLVLILVFWLSVIIGALDMKSIDSDFDVSKDIPMKDIPIKDLPAKDIPIEHIGAKEPGESIGVFLGLLRFFNFGYVPLMVVLSVLILSMWSISMLTNHPGSWVNPYNAYWVALLLSIPNIIVSLFITKIVTQPLVPIFRKLNTSERPLDYTGKMGFMTIGINKSEVGQVRVMINNSDVVLRVKTPDGSELKKGDKVLIIEEIPNEKCFIVQKIDLLPPKD